MPASMNPYPQSRNNAFAQGTGAAPSGTISSMEPQVPQADPMFHPTSVLDMYQNIPSGIGQDPRLTGATNTKTYGITKVGMGSNQGSSTMNV
jgi:hypothetical protein